MNKHEEMAIFANERAALLDKLKADISGKTAQNIMERVKEIENELGEIKTYGLDFKTQLQVEKASKLIKSLIADYSILL